jgi:hypothetical protein
MNPPTFIPQPPAGSATSMAESSHPEGLFETAGGYATFAGERD